MGLTLEFAHDREKQAQWAAFLKRNSLESPPLDVVVASLVTWLQPIMAEASKLRQDPKP